MSDTRPPAPTATGRHGLLDARHPRGVARPAGRPDPDQRPDLPDRHVRLGRRRRARATSSATLAPGTPTAGSRTRPRRALGERLRGAGRRRGRASPSPRGWARSTPRSPRSSGPATASSPRSRLYGSTRAQLLRHVRRLRGRRSSSSTRPTSTRSAAALAAGPTRVLYAETIANPTTFVADHAALAELAHRHGATYVVDNTFASPYVCRPLELGADLVVESATKFLGGHSDVIAGRRRRRARR